MVHGQLQFVDAEIIELDAGRYLALRDALGKGASATVYRALLCSRSGLRRWVAVKLFSLSSEEDDRIVEHLMHTARRAACVDHPNVARVYEFGLWRGRPFLISELVEGITLSAVQDAYSAKRRRFPLDLALFVACEVGEALTGARVARDERGAQLGVLHQGLCAREVLLSWRGEVKVTDFEGGVARAATSSVRSLRGVAGRLTAMPPEVARGTPPDARSDVFSFGVLLRELFAGPRFPPGLTSREAIRLAQDGFVQPLTFQPHLPEELVAVMARALEPSPEARYPNACAMTSELRRVALAMGVGDGRYFLRRALQRDWPDDVEETTAERIFGMGSEGYERAEAELIDLQKRRR